MNSAGRKWTAKSLAKGGWLALLFMLPMCSSAQQPARRVTQAVDTTSRVVINNSRSPVSQAAHDEGRVASGMRLESMSIVFKRSDAQEADLKSLLASQADLHSSSYHQWLDPAAFAARFGMNDADLAAVKAWLEQQGFAVGSVARSKNRLHFSGTAAQLESAFATELHSYQLHDTTIYAPSTDLSVPAALSSVVQSVQNVSSLRPRVHVIFKSPQRASPQFTSGNHQLQPGDVAVIYNITPAYSAGYTGAGQSIAIVGQSSIVLSDIQNFQNAAGLTVRDPVQVLMPNTGSAAVSTGDEAESDLDLEYSGGIAKDATIYFVYTGSDTNYGTFDAIQYAVDTRIAPIISNSYGTCETELSASDYSTLESVMEQASSQGQTVITAAGDSGSTDCQPDTGLTTAQREALAVDYPASSAYVTGMGGTEFPSADVSTSNTTYWTAASGSDVVTSALSYIPEQVWNDDSSSSGLSAGGGGTSALTNRPSWQAGVTGIPSGEYRLVPDLALDSSPNNAGYLYCSSDSTSTQITGSCSNGFRDSNDTYLTVAGGTSFAAPIFAGMLAIINQKENSTGQGEINATLYTLAGDSTSYASVFHDITSGGNQCTAGSGYCSSVGQSAYAAGAGYDEATGLGSVNFDNLLNSWPSTSSASLKATTTALTAASATPTSGASDAISITVAAADSTSNLGTTPTGSVTIEVDGTTQSQTLQLSSGAATYTFSSSTEGSHVIIATYSGDATYAASKGTTTVTIGGSSTGSSTGTFSLAATNITVAQGSSASSTITITSQNSYAGTVDLTLSTSSTSLNTYGCYDVTNPAVTSNKTVTTTLTIYTSETVCNTTASVKNGKRRNFVGTSRTAGSAKTSARQTRLLEPVSAVSALAGLLVIGLGRRRRIWHMVLGCSLLTLSLGAASGCGSSSSSSSTSTLTDVATGTYTVTVDGSDSSNSSISAETTFTLTVN